MFLRGEHPIDSSAQAFMIYLYTPDLPALREHLLANGLKISPIKYPEYMPSGMVNLADPDGYKLEIAHWSKSEQQAWEQRLQAKTGHSS